MKENTEHITVSAIIQARMSSSRLPQKVILPLGEKPVLYHVIKSALNCNKIDIVVLATSEDPLNKPLIELAEEMGIFYYEGSEHNVLERYYKASEKFGGDYIVRITADNPLTDSFYADKIISKAIETESDITSFNNLPLGTAVEVIKKTALDDAMKNSSEPYHFEHVSPYLKERPEKYKITRVESDFNTSLKNLRLTIDTPDDYSLFTIIFNKLKEQNLEITLNNAVQILEENPKLCKINSHVKHRPMTHSENEK